MFPRSYFAGVYFAPVYFPPVIAIGPAPKRDAQAFGEAPYDYLELDDQELMELIPILMIALEEA